MKRNGLGVLGVVGLVLALGTAASAYVARDQFVRPAVDETDQTAKMDDGAEMRARMDRSVAEHRIRETTLPTEHEGPVAGDSACLAYALSARLHIQFGSRGCFGGSDNTIDLAVGGSGSVSGSLFQYNGKRITFDDLPISRHEARRYLREFVRTLETPETVSDQIHSTSSMFARISYFCDGKKTGPLMLKRDAMRSSDGYTPVAGVARLARIIFDILPDDPADESDVERQHRYAKWNTLYKDGMRVRHDPIEDWQDP